MASPDQQRRDTGDGDLKLLDHKPKSVALVCMGPSVVDYLTATLTQEFNHRWVDEVWVINMGCNPFRADVVFWLDDLAQQQKFRPPLMDALNHFGMPVITSKAYPDIVPNSYDCPISPIAAMGTEILGKPYLNNGVAMAIAYALHIGVKRMCIYGADFSYPNRDFAESGRGCTETWVTIAGMKGMEIALCPGTSLMDTVKDHGIYGYSVQPEIRLNNGRIYKYFLPTEQGARGKYIPEDSSGAQNEQHHAAPSAGEGSRPASADASGRDDHPVEAERAAPQPTDPFGDGVRHPGRSQRRQKRTLALHDSSGAAGQVPVEAGQ